MKNEEKDIKQRVTEMTTRNITISGMPEDVFRRFSNYAKVHTADCYWMAVKELLNICEANSKEVILFERLSEVEQRMSQVEEHVINQNKPAEKSKTFGMRKVEKDE